MLAKLLLGAALAAAVLSLPSAASAYERSGYRDRDYSMRDREVPPGWRNKTLRGHDQGRHYGWRRGQHFGWSRDDRYRDRDRNFDRDRTGGDYRMKKNY
jgi:hypothetical protein